MSNNREMKNTNLLTNRKQHIKAALLLVATIFLAALVTVLAKVTLERVSPFTFNWLQLLTCLVFLTIFTFVVRREPWPTNLTLRQWAYPALIGIANFTIVRYLFLASLEYLPVTTHAYLVNFVGLVTMSISIFVMQEKPFLIQFLGAVIALSGITVFFDEIPAPEQIKGILMLAIGVFFLALTNNLIRRFMVKHKQTLSPVMLSTLAIWIGGLPLIFLGAMTEYKMLTFSLTDWSVIILNGVIGLGVTLIVFNKVMAILRSYEASILASTGIIWVGILAIPIAGEVLKPNNIVGIVILFFGIFMSQLKIPYPFWFKKKDKNSSCKSTNHIK
ncbi:MAG: DMT family transporter [Gammaproteobacteria bacterium]|nr:DMT family transporter [Gammaproteobacteria bacterium]